MAILGWKSKYKEILSEFNFKENDDLKSARLLNSLLKDKISTGILTKLIKNKTVFVIGAGPSLPHSLPTLKKFPSITKIVADGAAAAMDKEKLRPDIIVTDLDGDLEIIKKYEKKNVLLVVHAHGDNFDELKIVSKFKNCLGTTQTKPFGNIHNFGGFTDGDRGVFLANHFRAKKIILFGMDFGNEIGKFSKKKVVDKQLKIKKLARGKKLLEWLSTKNYSELYTTSKPIEGFKKIRYNAIKRLVQCKNAF